MLKPVIVVKDIKLGLYETPFVVRHAGEAIREWDDVRKDPKTKFGKHPEDYELYQVATFNEENAEMQPLQQYLQLA